MKIVYLVQGSLDDLLVVQELIPNNQYLISLNYEAEPDVVDLKSNRHLYFPDSTWAEGRNLLLETAQKTEIDFDYFVFLDADLRVGKGDFILFENLLDTHRPKLGLPLGDQIKNSYRYLPNARVQTQFSFDQIMQAYRADVVTEAICIPYVTEFDSDSWWYSCEINSYLSVHCCGDKIIQFNDFEIVNSRHDGPELELAGHSKYKAGVTPEGLKKCREFISSEYPLPKKIVGTLFHPSYVPKLILFPSLKQLLLKQFGEHLQISIGGLLKATLKSLQIALFRTVLRHVHLENKPITDR
jgi:hypothetical protein